LRKPAPRIVLPVFKCSLSKSLVKASWAVATSVL
jgi:hypothetical protein